MKNKYVCIHGHFYQPPRENPWLEEIEVQESARPYRDWNERITAECYSPNSAARILGPDLMIEDIINNYSRMSFNFGPTLLSWMERHAGDVYEAILEADIQSRKRFSGHGSAIAQVYNHMIMPLANERDRRTQIIWGIEDFVHRFGRDPEGMWLAETAVDTATLELLAEYGIRFTILAPRQAARVRRQSEDEWRDVSDALVDPRKPYRMNLPSGREITLFFYDGPISQAIAFGNLLKNGENLANRLIGTLTPHPTTPELAHIATDGETYGHHQHHGDMALAYCLHWIEAHKLARLTIYGEFLEISPPEDEVRIIENSSWSCVHGIERWRSDCGCNSGVHGWRQTWRGPLRATYDRLRDDLETFYEAEAEKLVRDPWELRNRYIRLILDRSPRNMEAFLKKELMPDRERLKRALLLLEMQRHLMLMYTSCGWFFDELSGIETVQTIHYAARAIQLATRLGRTGLESTFIDRLGEIPSNLHHVKTGRKVYDLYVRPAVIDLHRVAAHFAVSSLFTEYEDPSRIFSFVVNHEAYERWEAGRYRMVVGRARFRSVVTLEEETLSFAFLHLGDHNLNGGVRRSHDIGDYPLMQEEMKIAFARLDIARIILHIDTHFGSHNYSLRHLFKEESRRFYSIIMESALRDIEQSFRQIYENQYPIMQSMIDTGTPLPNAIRTPVEFVLNEDIKKALENDAGIDTGELTRLHDEAIKWSVKLDREAIAYTASGRITREMEAFEQTPIDQDIMGTIADTLETLRDLSIEPNLWKAQNILFRIQKDLYESFLERAKTGHPAAAQWIESFNRLEHLMNGGES